MNLTLWNMSSGTAGDQDRSKQSTASVNTLVGIVARACHVFLVLLTLLLPRALNGYAFAIVQGRM